MKATILGANVIELQSDNGNVYLQSYNTVVACKGGAKLTLDPDWEYSKTTVKHVCQWLGTDAKSLRKRIANGEVVVAKLNGVRDDSPAIDACKAVLEWARTPGDHGGNPYAKEFVRLARLALGE